MLFINKAVGKFVCIVLLLTNEALATSVCSKGAYKNLVLLLSENANVHQFCDTLPTNSRFYNPSKCPNPLKSLVYKDIRTFCSCLKQACASRPCPYGFDTCAKTCGATCVKLKTDPQNCGKCGQKCTKGKQCISGGCVTPSTFTTTAKYISTTTKHTTTSSTTTSSSSSSTISSPTAASTTTSSSTAASTTTSSFTTTSSTTTTSTTAAEPTCEGFLLRDTTGRFLKSSLRDGDANRIQSFTDITGATFYTLVESSILDDIGSPWRVVSSTFVGTVVTRSVDGFSTLMCSFGSDGFLDCSGTTRPTLNTLQSCENNGNLFLGDGTRPNCTPVELEQIPCEAKDE
ncbi:hypothetical protein BST61_g9220 [Cercospora zeina]